VVLDPSTLGLWERYTDEFLHSREAWPPSVLEELTRAEYIGRASSICGAASDELMNAPESVWPENAPESAGPEYERATYEAAARTSEEALAQLRELDPPLPDRARVNEVYALMEQQIDHYRQAAAGELAPGVAGYDLQVARAIESKGTMYGLHLCPTHLGS
jgi:hypothetical protein